MKNEKVLKLLTGLCSNCSTLTFLQKGFVILQYTSFFLRFAERQRTHHGKFASTADSIFVCKNFVIK